MQQMNQLGKLAKESLDHHSFCPSLRVYAAIGMASLAMFTGCCPSSSPEPQRLGDLKEQLGIKTPGETMVVMNKHSIPAKRAEFQQAVDAASRLQGDLQAFSSQLYSRDRLPNIPEGIKQDFRVSLERSITAFRSALTNQELSVIEHGTLASVGEQTSVVLELLKSGRLNAKNGNEIYNSVTDGNTEQLGLLHAKIETTLWTLAKPQ